MIAGLRVVITRAREQASELAVKLAAAGAVPIELPVIELRDPEDWSPVDAAVARIESFDWILFTSANAVRFLATRMPAGVSNIRAKVCCIGPKTRSVAEAAGWRVTLVPDAYVAESVAEAFAGQALKGQRIFLPRAAVARDLVPQALRDRGADVEIVEVYRNAIPADAAANASEVFGGEGPRPDWIAFTSSSTVKNLLAVTGRENLAGVRLASIGPATSETARKHGLSIDAEASPHTLDGLVEAIGGVLESRRAE
jgi:uroporphyrinogen III methyltransferase/synthase